jgi:hypothetical protein
MSHRVLNFVCSMLVDDVAYLTHSTRDAANSPAQCVEVVPTELTAVNLLQ